MNQRQLAYARSRLEIAQLEQDVIAAALCQIVLNGEPSNRVWLAADDSERYAIVLGSNGSAAASTWDRETAFTQI